MKILSIGNIIGATLACALIGCFWFLPGKDDGIKQRGLSNYDTMIVEFGRNDENATGLGDWLPTIIGSSLMAVLIGYIVRQICMKWFDEKNHKISCHEN